MAEVDTVDVEAAVGLSLSALSHVLMIPVTWVEVEVLTQLTFPVLDSSNQEVLYKPQKE